MSVNPHPETEKFSIPDIPDELYEHLKKFLVSEDNDTEENEKRVLEYRVLMKALGTYPESNVKLYQGIKEVAYAIWTDKPKKRIATNCEAQYLLFEHLTNHATSSAVIAARLISIARQRCGVDEEFTDYSAQYLLNAFHNYDTPQRRRPTKKKSNSKVTPVSIPDAIEYARKNKIPTATDWPYVGLNSNIQQHDDVPLFEVVGVTQELNLDSALDILQYQPVAAKLCVFYPEYEDAGDGIYRGPIYLKKDTGKKPSWERLYDVMVCQTKIMEGGELVAVVKFPCPNVPYLNVSLDVCLTNDNIEGIAEQEPTHLLRDFLAILPPDDASSSRAPTP